ncbi:MAG: hypothetical protein KTR29_19655 [Rhodothermaceae bacterium]|nr:hypothetical protein [Rhodothermaceae bacterium]
MRAFIIQISGLAGLATLFNHLWSDATLERTLFVSIGVGLAVYFVLSISDSFIRNILASAPSTENSIEDANIKSETLEDQKVDTEISNPAQA